MRTSIARRRDAGYGDSSMLTGTRQTQVSWSPPLPAEPAEEDTQRRLRLRPLSRFHVYCVLTKGWGTLVWRVGPRWALVCLH